MNKERLKGIITGMIICSVLFTSVFAFAETSVTRQIHYGVNVALDGRPLVFDEDSRPFIMDGRTFLPIRAIADAVGMPVHFDADTGTVYLGRRPHALRVDGVWNLRMMGQNPHDFTDSVMMRWAAAEIRSRTNGAVVIEHFPAGMLGDYVGGFEEIMLGTIEMAAITVPVHIDQRFGIVYIPFVATDYDDLRRLWQPGTNLFGMLHDILYDSGLKMFGLLPGGMMGIGTAVPFNRDNVWDFTMPSDELLIRIPPFQTIHVMADVMQLRITEIPFADLYPALFLGVVDGWIGGGAELNYALARDLINYFYDFRYYDDTLTIFMNLDVYYSMPLEYRRIIQEVMLEASSRALDEMAARDAEFMDRLRGHGITIVAPTPAERARMADQFRRYGWPRFVDIFGRDPINLLLDDLGLPPL